MSALDLHAFVDRSRALVDAGAPTTRRETRAWIVDPFLETLGWDVHAEACYADTSVDGTRLEYVTAVDGVPALFVAVEPYEESLDRSRALALLETMAWTGVDRGIYTNGRDYLLFAGTTDADRLACRLSSLPDHEPAIAHFSRDRVGRHLEHHTREFVARQLALERTALVDAITADLTSAVERGEAYATEFESAANRFLERLVTSFADDDQRRVADELDSGTGADVSIEFSEATISPDETEESDDRHPEPTVDDRSWSDEGDEEAASVGDSSGTDTSTSGGTDTDTDAGVSGTRPDAADGDPDRTTTTASGHDETDSDGEYVVRFFNERNSIGAIGHGSSDGALVQAAEYLFERGLSGLSVPWGPDDTDDGRALVNDEPTHPDGTPMTAPEELSNGLYLETAGDTDDHAAAVEALGSRAGLRAMLTGDWG